MATSVQLTDDVMTQFEAFKMRKGRICRYIVFTLDKHGVIKVEVEGGDKDGYEQFTDHLKEIQDGCRYALYDMTYKTADNREGSKIVFFSWSPETAPVKSKMLYASSKAAIIRQFEGVDTVVHATDLSELDEECVKSRFCK
ncbi:unnamed protein product [Albugo candida]|uniref:ADF-H domain-containing protein n=1 Tax=Albugo candida TaxID=65357 RepID=A0A024G5V2_9STRA|nr:unnamed protein product [Albugo candida]|eukprot:CCI42042.1 unnamed protein product [Albugo candida]